MNWKLVGTIFVILQTIAAVSVILYTAYSIGYQNGIDRGIEIMRENK